MTDGRGRMAHRDHRLLRDRRQSSLNNEPLGALCCFSSHLFTFWRDHIGIMVTLPNDWGRMDHQEASCGL